MDDNKEINKAAAVNLNHSKTTTVLPEKVEVSLSTIQPDKKPSLTMQIPPTAPTLFAKPVEVSEKDVKSRNRFLEVISAVKNKKVSAKLEVVEKLSKAFALGNDAVEKVIADEKIGDVKTFLIQCEEDVDNELLLVNERIKKENINMPDVLEELKKQKTKYGFEMIFNVIHSIPGISYIDDAPDKLNEKQAVLSDKKGLEWLLRHVQAVGFLLLEDNELSLGLKPE